MSLVKSNQAQVIKNEKGKTPIVWLLREQIAAKSWKKKPQLSFVKKNQDIKKILIKPIEMETLKRHLFCFELELKEYSPSTFESIKQFINKKDLSADEIHEEIEQLAEAAAKQKYFPKVFPANTIEKLENELENYLFMILYSRLFLIDDDVRGFSYQFQDRLNVLKSLVTFEMLDIPHAMRDDSLYTAAIQELQKMPQFRTPMWKLQTFQNCVEHILNIFSQTVQKSPSSDELFPVLVYVVLQANVDLLKYNVDYIYTYLRKSHLMGQLGFLIINLKAIIKFLQDLDGRSLSEGKLEMKKL